MMGNPIMSLLGKTNPAMQTISQMVGMLKAAQNPEAAFSQMSSNDPRIQQVMQYVNQNGGDAKTAFYRLAQQRGVDPNEILSQLRSI